MEFKDIIESNISCWYELSWQENPPAIILRIHTDFIKEFKTEHPPEEWPIIKSFKEKFGFKDFGGNFDQDIGFEKVFKYTGENQGFIEYVTKIPQIQKSTCSPCQQCNGTGKDEWRGEGEICFFCEGTGKERVMDWQRAYAISASFTVLLIVLSSFNLKENTSILLPQLLTIKTTTHKDMHGGSFGGEISIPLREWLASLGDNATIPEMVKAMKKAHKQMFGLHDYESLSFKVYVRSSGAFFADCPGNACGIHPSDRRLEKGKGYEFSCHNVDTPAQQIVLLAGLAALCDKARKK